MTNAGHLPGGTGRGTSQTPLPSAALQVRGDPDTVRPEYNECWSAPQVRGEPTMRWTERSANEPAPNERQTAVRGTVEARGRTDHANRRMAEPQHMVAAGRLRHTGELPGGDNTKGINYTNTLGYYDGVQAFAVRDADGTRYVGVVLGSTDEADTYLRMLCTSEWHRWDIEARH